MRRHPARTLITARKYADFSSGNQRSAVEAVVLAAALVVWSVAAPRLPSRWHPIPHAAVGTALAAFTRAPLGLRPPALGSGLRWGAAAAAPTALGVAAASMLRPVRDGMAARELPDAVLRWLAVGIPLGTVWSEETAYRAALGTAAAAAFGLTGGRLVQSAAFGLSHITDARSAAAPVLPTVLATGAAGWLFAWLYERSGSLIAPMLAHLAVNEAGAVAALTVQHIGSCARTRGAPQ
jgi:membrane protease YdiL (CAAX protease family)